MKLRLVQFVTDEPRCAERDLQFGHLTASAIVLDSSLTRVLLVYHKKLGRWLQPGGHADGSFDLLSAAIREVFEETGVRAVPESEDPIDIDIHQIPARADFPGHWHYDVRYLLKATEDSIAMQEEEVLDVRWFTEDEVLSATTDDSATRLVAKAFARTKGL